MDAIFKALGDPARRTLLDALRKKDGQSLSDLEAQLDMSRFGVMKHLKVLEDAHLIVTRKDGRFKYHYLNALPLQEVADRWIEPLVQQPTARAVTRLKRTLESETKMTKPDYIMQTFIDCTHDALWDALTKGELMGQYHFSCDKVVGDHEKPDDQIDMYFSHDPDTVMLSNRVISIDPKSRIEMTFVPGWGENPNHSRCVYLLDPEPTGMKLTIEHYDLAPSDEGVKEGWARFAAGLKTWLETGNAVRFPMNRGA